MLKKLVKYGNSQALVLDKSILELLNIEEGALLKLKTDGESLIITPKISHAQKSEPKPPVVSPSIDVTETLKEAGFLEMKKHNPLFSQENFEEKMVEIRAIASEIGKWEQPLNDNPQFIQDREKLQSKYAGDLSNPQYLNELEELKTNIEPRLAPLYQQVRAIQNNLSQGANLQNSFQGFSELVRNNRSVMEKLAKLNESPEYIHETVILAERFKNGRDSKEYVEAVQELNAKYVPEYKKMIEEIKNLSGI